MPTTPHLVSGKVYDIYSIALEGATVTLTHSNGSLGTTTNSSGQYNFNLGQLSSWTAGDDLSITASKTGDGSKTTTPTISSGGGQTENITLEEEEQIVGMTSSSMAKINKVMLISYDERDINRTNRLPVDMGDAFAGYRPSDEDASGDPSYYGFLDRFGKWYIMRYDVGNGTFRYIKGSSDYETNWTNKADLTYRYFHQVF